MIGLPNTCRIRRNVAQCSSKCIVQSIVSDRCRASLPLICDAVSQLLLIWHYILRPILKSIGRLDEVNEKLIRPEEALAMSGTARSRQRQVILLSLVGSGSEKGRAWQSRVASMLATRLPICIRLLPTSNSAAKQLATAAYM